MSDELLETIRTSKYFYRDNFRRLILTCYILMVINFAFIGIIFYYIVNPGSVSYYGTRTDGVLLPLTPTIKNEQQQ